MFRMTDKTRVMLDTNIFNRILDGQFSVSGLPNDSEVLVTHVQFDELRRTKSVERRETLLHTFSTVDPEEISTDSASWGISKWGRAKWTREHSLVREIREKLDHLNGGKASNLADALIADTSIQNHCFLITEDSDLRKVVRELGGEALSMADIPSIGGSGSF